MTQAEYAALMGEGHTAWIAALNPPTMPANPPIIAGSKQNRLMTPEEFTTLFSAHQHEGGTYQQAFHDHIASTRPAVIVETGFGVSTCFALKAMNDGDFGHIYSIDPSPWCGFSINHRRATFIPQTSYDALASLYYEVNPWDLFLHDSNHDKECQSFEFEVVIRLLRPGGWLWADDYTWGEHHAWSAFCQKHKLTPVHFGSAEAVRKPLDWHALHPGEVFDYVASVRQWAQEVGDAWRASGHPDSSAFSKIQP